VPLAFPKRKNLLPSYLDDCILCLSQDQPETFEHLLECPEARGLLAEALASTSQSTTHEQEQHPVAEWATLDCLFGAPQGPTGRGTSTSVSSSTPTPSFAGPGHGEQRAGQWAQPLYATRARDTCATSKTLSALPDAWPRSAARTQPHFSSPSLPHHLFPFFQPAHGTRTISNSQAAASLFQTQ
jgi:hypothetical protein